MSGSAIVLGDAVLDITVHPAAAPVPGGDAPATIRISAGGQGANLAVRLARQGMSVRLVCGLTDDAAGAFVADSLERERVTLSPVPVAATGTVVILLDAVGERTMFSHRAPFATRAGAEPQTATDWVMVSGYLLLEADAAQLVGSVLPTAARRVVVGCAIPPGTEAAWLQSATALRPDVVIVNRAEADALALDRGPASSLLVVTDATGAIASLGELAVTATAPRGHAPADTTGAGDAFAAAFIATLSPAPWPPSRDALGAALAAGVRLASAVAGVPGAQGAVEGERAGVTMNP